jgi:hypothetical protein
MFRIEESGELGTAIGGWGEYSKRVSTFIFYIYYLTIEKGRE